MKEKEFKSCFFQWRIPKNLRDLIMKEMQEIGLLKREKGKVILNNYYFEKDFKKTSTDFKDGDTKIENPYLSKDLL